MILGAIKIQDSLAHTLGVRGDDVRIEFAPGETGDIEHAYRLSDLSVQRSKVSEIERYLAELRDDVKDAD